MIIQNTKEIKELYINALVFGEFKLGKTYLLKELADAGKKVFCISAENGMLGLKGVNIDYKITPTLESVNEILDFLENKCDYDWVCLDTVTEFGQNIYPVINEKHKKLAERKSLEDKKTVGVNGMHVWGEFGQVLGVVIKRLRNLPCNTLTLAHPIQKEQEDAMIKTAPDIYGKTANKIIGWLDETYYMFKDEKMKEENYHKFAKNRLFLTQETERTKAGSRSQGSLDKLEPASIIHIQNKILGSKIK